MSQKAEQTKTLVVFTNDAPGWAAGGGGWQASAKRKYFLSVMTSGMRKCVNAVYTMHFWCQDHSLA